MLQHSTTDFYDLSSTTSISNRQTPPYSPTGGTAASVISANNNNNNSSNNNNNSLDTLQNGGSTSCRDEALAFSFGFTQEQVACVCEVSLNVYIVKFNRSYIYFCKEKLFSL